jgi:hypothetical protein
MTDSRDKTALGASTCALSCADTPDFGLSAVVQAWPNLSAEVRQSILAMFENR